MNPNHIPHHIQPVSYPSTGSNGLGGNTAKLKLPCDHPNYLYETYLSGFRRKGSGLLWSLTKRDTGPPEDSVPEPHDLMPALLNRSSSNRPQDARQGDLHQSHCFMSRRNRWLYSQRRALASHRTRKALSHGNNGTSLPRPASSYRKE